jgi:hypothetical protein
MGTRHGCSPTALRHHSTISSVDEPIIPSGQQWMSRPFGLGPSEPERDSDKPWVRLPVIDVVPQAVAGMHSSAFSSDR